MMEFASILLRIAWIRNSTLEYFAPLVKDVDPYFSVTCVSWLMFITLSLLTLFLVPRSCRLLASLCRSHRVSVTGAHWGFVMTEKELTMLVALWACWLLLLRSFGLAVKLEVRPFEPYTILGVTETATAREITSAYKKQSLRFNPDKLQGIDTLLYQDYFATHVSKAYQALVNTTMGVDFQRLGHLDATTQNRMHSPDKPSLKKMLKQYVLLISKQFHYTTGGWTIGGKVTGAMVTLGAVAFWMRSPYAPPAVTIFLVVANLAINLDEVWLPLKMQAFFKIPDQIDGFLSPYHIIQNRQYSRLFWSSLLHGDNCIIWVTSSLINKGATMEMASGQVDFGILMLQLTLMTNGLVVGFAYAFAKLFGNFTAVYYGASGVGMLPVMFALNVVPKFPPKDVVPTLFDPQVITAVLLVEMWFVTEETMFVCFCGILAGVLHTTILGQHVDAITMLHGVHTFSKWAAKNVKLRAEFHRFSTE